MKEGTWLRTPLANRWLHWHDSAPEHSQNENGHTASDTHITESF